MVVPLSSTATRSWPIREAPVGRAGDRPSAALRSLEREQPVLRESATQQTGPRLAALARMMNHEPLEVQTLEQAVRQAAQLAEPGDCVLLSPGCASWDMFENYQARGKAFCQFAQSCAKPAVPVK